MSLYRAYARMANPRTVVIPAPIKARSVQSAETKARAILRRDDWGRPDELFIVNIFDASDKLGEPLSEV